MKELVKKLKMLLNKNPKIEDFIIFGSLVKGKSNYKDIDIAILSDNEIEKETINEIKKISDKTDIQKISIKNIHNSIFLTLIKEGYSTKYEKYLHEIYKIEPVKLYKYNLKKLTPSKKVMFERGIKFITGIKKLSNSVVLVPIKKTEEFNEFLKTWDLDIETWDYELLPVLRKEEL